MKILKNVVVAIALTTLFAACQQSSTDVKQLLSKSETRKEIIDSIASDSSLHKEMMEAMMVGKHSHSMMMGNHEAMMKKMKDNPAMMEAMMSDMMEKCKNDSTMMKGMCNAMMASPEMMEMMNKMKDKKMDMNKMKGMDNMKGMDHPSNH